MQTLWQDVRYGARILLKNPGFTLIALITLSLGIGVNTALFAGFNLLLRPIPVTDPESLVKIERQRDGLDVKFSNREFVDFRDQAQSLTDFLAVYEVQLMLGEQTPEEAKAVFVSDNYWSSLGGRLQLGRFFTSEENRSRAAVAVLSHYCWLHRFDGDRNIVGRRLLLGGKPFEIIGVASPDFVGLQMEMPDVWAPLMAQAEIEGRGQSQKDRFGEEGDRWLSLYARLARRRTLAQAQEELAQLDRRSARSTESGGSRHFINVEPAIGAGGKKSLWVVMTVVLGASGMVLLIACSNIANMLLARAAARQKEIGVRLALGASRGRVIRQLMTECFLISCSGGLAGILFAWWSVQLLFPWVFGRSDGRDFSKTALSLTPDWRVLFFALALSFLSGVAFGLVPALRATRPDLVAVINNDIAAFGGRIARSRLRNGLVIGQVALCLTLLIPAGLLSRALTKGFASERGFEPEKILTVDYIQALTGPELLTADAFQQQLITRLAAVPGVKSVCPQADRWSPVKITLLNDHGQEALEGKQFEDVLFQWVTAGYLETIGTPLMLGKGFSRDDVESKAPVMIVSESTARNLWPGDNPIGKTIRIEGPLFPPKTGIGILMPQARVIGVARDNQIHRAGHIPAMFFYAPRPPIIKQDDQLLVRTVGEAAGLKDPVRNEAQQQPSLGRLRVGTMASVSGETSTVNVTRIASELAMVLGGLALLLATLGLYGVMAFTVSQRTREIGVRMALGAMPGNVQALVIAQGMKLVLIGVLIGVPLAMAASQLMKGMLFGLSTLDPATYGGVTLLLAIAGLVACWAPARHAARVNPMIALRAD
jgi:predicted permease